MFNVDFFTPFTNTPIPLALKIMNRDCDSIVPYTGVTSNSIYMEGLKLILNNGYLIFNGQWHKQILDLPMWNIIKHKHIKYFYESYIDPGFKNFKFSTKTYC